MNRSEQVNELFSALAKAQAEMRPAGKTSDNPFFKSRYADFNEIVKASRPALTKNGLAVLQRIISNEDGSFMETMLGHSSGQFISSEMKINPIKTDVQSLGSYLTYLKRYSYAAIVGVCVSDEDDDGEAAMIEEREEQRPTGPLFITKEQLEQLDDELADAPEIKDTILEKMNIKSLHQMPRHSFIGALKRVREIKAIKTGRV